MNTPKYQFCQEVLKFLRSEYQDSYTFKIDYYQSLDGKEAMELQIKASGLTRKIGDSYMNHFYALYCEGLFLEDRKQFEWQKELIDLIEGS